MSDRVQFSVRIASDCLDEELDFVVKLGFDGVYTWVRDDQTDFESIQRIKDKVESCGLKLFTVHNYNLSKSTEIQLALPGRDVMIDKFCALLEALGGAGVPSTNFTWEPINTLYWNHPQDSVTRGATSRHIDVAEITTRPLLHGREYELEELWDNYEYFIKRVIPVAEANQVGLALHPNDPPIIGAGGIPFLIKSRDDYDRAFSVVNSNYLGMEFCVGCWLEGGRAFGDVTEGFKHYYERGKVMVIHFRNVSATLPVFDETYIDNGYMDMYQLAKTIAKSGYTGSLILDHLPRMNTSYGEGSALAYSFGYLKCMFDRAYDELNNDWLER